MAASATLALKAGVWFRRGRLFMVSPVRGDHRRFQAETPLIALFKFAEPALPNKNGYTKDTHFQNVTKRGDSREEVEVKNYGRCFNFVSCGGICKSKSVGSVDDVQCR